MFLFTTPCGYLLSKCINDNLNTLCQCHHFLFHSSRPFRMTLSINQPFRHNIINHYKNKTFKFATYFPIRYVPIDGILSTFFSSTRSISLTRQTKTTSNCHPQYLDHPWKLEQMKDLDWFPDLFLTFHLLDLFFALQNLNQTHGFISHKPFIFLKILIFMSNTILPLSRILK